MFRLFFLAFFGKERAGQHAMSHIHESPKSITIPLAVLAVLSVLGGFLNVPESLGGNAMLGNYLADVFKAAPIHEMDHGTEQMLMAVIIILTIVMIGFAWFIYIKKDSVPVDPRETTGITRVLSNKYYVDEIYNALVVKPLYGLSKAFYTVIELLGIDNLVNGLGKGVVYASRGLRFFQDGSIGYYLFVMVVGIIIILGMSIVG
jgi:NADH-quinone oxidoreductase subunit L